MNKPDSLKKIERKAYRSRYDDGVIDMLFAMAFLMLSVQPMIIEMGIPTIHLYFLGAIGMAVAFVFRRLVTVPRLGLVEFSPKRRARKWVLVVIAAAIFFLIMPLLMMQSFGRLPAWVTVGPIVALVISLAAYLLDYPRLYIYAALIVYGFLQSDFLYSLADEPLPSVVSFGIPGIAILAYSLMLLFRFLNRYPKPDPEANHAS